MYTYIKRAFVAVLVQDVHLERLLGVECVAARLTDEVSAREVERHVTLQVVVFSRLIRTVGTAVGLDARVIAHVTVQRLLPEYSNVRVIDRQTDRDSVGSGRA